MPESESLARSQIIALKLINIFDVYAIQQRIHMYRRLLNNPTEQESIFQELVLHNVFAIRTKYDLGLIQQITQELYTELTTNMTLRKFESILFQLIPELDSTKRAYLDVIGKSSGRIDENERGIRISKISYYK